MTTKTYASTDSILPFQPEFRPALPCVYGNVDYRRFEILLKRIDEILRLSGVENLFVKLSLEDYRSRAVDENVEVKDWALVLHQQRSVQALRCEVLRKLLGEDFREMSCRLAQCALFQWFCQIDQLDGVRVPSKSALQMYAHWLPEDSMREVIGALMRAVSEEKEHPLDLAQGLDMAALWMDTTCVKANIHFPVDWILLRDAVRTLMKATMVIRRRGLKHRMEEPSIFLRRMNTLCMEMSAARRKTDSKRSRKKILRGMKQLLRVVEKHARRYYALLNQEWERTDLTRRQAEQISRRIDGVLQLLPQAIHQAHERIIGERAVPNHEKILSLYETDLHVIVRGKANAEVEFGNQLLLAEQRDGYILDWILEKENISANNRMLAPSLQRTQKNNPQIKLKSLATDRGFVSQENSEILKQLRIFDGICPKNPRELQQRMQQSLFATLQHRRASTEARIGIFKNVFLGTPLRSKGFANRNLAVAWSILAHNLWILARLPKRKTEPILLA